MKYKLTAILKTTGITCWAAKNVNWQQIKELTSNPNYVYLIESLK